MFYYLHIIEWMMSVAAVYRIPMTFNARLGASYMQAVVL
jgi:hypothetical protein